MRRIAAGLALLLAVLSGCAESGDDPPDPVAESPLPGCEELTAAPPQAPASSPATGLAALTLTCFTGGDPFPLTDLHGPAVVNLWASWCGPCRAELPLLQRYAEEVAGEVHVLGVVTEDRHSAAASLAQDLGLTFPSLDDPDGSLTEAAGFAGLPATMFVDAAGELAYTHVGPLDEATLAEHAAEYL